MKTPEGPNPLGFSIRYGELLRLGCSYLFIPVQPFAYVVANHTCYDRDKKRDDDIFHSAHLLSAGGSAANTEYHISWNSSTHIFLNIVEYPFAQRVNSNFFLIFHSPLDIFPKMMYICFNDLV